MGRIVRALVITAAFGSLLWWSLRGVSPASILTAFMELRLSQVVLLLAINAVVVSLITARWWLIVRASKSRIPFLPMVWYRLAVFGLSYFTPGPQIGGEPLQVVYLLRDHGLSSARATSAVIVDKLVEFLTNFLMLSIGFWAVMEIGLFAESRRPSIVGLAGLGLLIAWPAIHLALLYRRVLPITRLVKVLPFIPKGSRPVRMLLASERMAADFCRKHTAELIGAIGVSILAMAGIALEYALMAGFLGVQLTPVEILAALTFLQLAFLAPLPGGMGVLEASQVFVFGALGQPAAAAISLTLLQRGRDVLNGGLGLLIAGKGFGLRKDNPSPPPEGFVV